MPYSQIISLMIAMALVAGAPSGPEPTLSHGAVLFLWVVKTLGWTALVVWFLNRSYAGKAPSPVLDGLQWASLIPLIIDFYLLNIKTYLVFLPGVFLFPTLIEIAGISLYILYFILLLTSYWWVLYRKGLSESPLRENLEFRVRLILPFLVLYLILAVLGDLLGAIPSNEFQELLKKPFGELASSVFCLILILVFMPPMVRMLWGCVPFPKGPLRNLIEDFLKRTNVSCKEILIWPMSGGGSCTAAVLGLVPGFRYILFTPCLVKHLLPQEIEAVLSHEVAHLRHRHLLWYIFFIGTFAIIVYRLFDPIETWLISRRLFLEILTHVQHWPGALIAFLAILPMGILLVLYFRFLLGYFMRNFERQADLSVFESQGHPWNLINALEKVAILAGDIRNQPNWHHFSIAERVNFLEEVARRPIVRDEYEKKLFLNKGLFIGIASLLIIIPSLMPIQSWKDSADNNLTQLYIEQLTRNGEQRPELYVIMGQIFAQKKEYANAVKAYKQALDLAPGNPDILNNIAWIYATADDPEFQKPKEALMFASMAANLKPAGYILDTLAECFFINGYVEKAIATEEEALKKDPSKTDYYRAQLERFKKTGGMNHGIHFDKKQGKNRTN
ncbi:MAG: M48 family metalloprotease [Thermodesulfobacteriota bacterium]|nr:M48 family metalloprotease [Thermodesulfobacteriota bacterium]